MPIWQQPRMLAVAGGAVVVILLLVLLNSGGDKPNPTATRPPIGNQQPPPQLPGVAVSRPVEGSHSSGETSGQQIPPRRGDSEFTALRFPTGTVIAPLTQGLLAHEDSDRYKWGEIPAFLEGMTVTQFGMHQGVSEFTASTAGRVWMAVSPRWGGGNVSGGPWQNELTAEDEFLAFGWKEIGSLPYHDKESLSLTWSVHERVFSAGESYRIRNEKYLCPVYFFPPGKGAISNDDSGIFEAAADREAERLAGNKAAMENTAAEKGTTGTLPPPNKPDETPLEPAVVSVERLARVPFTIEADPTLLPPALQGATTWSHQDPNGADVSKGVLRFKVIESGEVYLVANWKYQGNRSGGWYEERLTREQLVERGWQDLGPCVWDREVYLLKRQVKKGESYVIRTNKYSPPDLVLRGKSNSPVPTRPPVSIDPQARVISGLGDRLDGKSVATIRIFDLKMAVYRLFEIAPKAKDGEKQQPGWNKVPKVLRQDYVHSSPVPYRGIIQFDILEEGVVLAAVTAHQWGDQGLSGGEWQKTVQSREQLTELGWQEVGPLPGGGLAEWLVPEDRLLIYRVCKKGEVLHLRTKKYSTPVIITPALAR